MTYLLLLLAVSGWLSWTLGELLRSGKLKAFFIIIKFVKMLVSLDSSEIYHLVALTQAV